MKTVNQPKITNFNIVNTSRLLLIALSLILGINACKDNATGASDTKKQEEPSAITGDEAIQTVAQILEDQGFELSSTMNKARRDQTRIQATDLSTEDYLTTEVNEDGERIVHLSIGPDGHIIPSGAWRDAHPNVCEDQNRFMKGAVNELRFKLFHLSDGYDVFIQYIDVETGKIQNQQEGEATSLKDALNKAWDKLDVDIKSATGPCGRLKGFKFVFDSKMTAIHGDATVIEQVQAQFNLSASTDEVEGYDGSGALKWVQIVPMGTYCSVPDGSLTVTKLVYPESEVADDIGLNFSFEALVGQCQQGLAYPPIWKPDWVTLHFNEVGKDGETFHIEGWETVPDDDTILARRLYDRTVTITAEDGTTMDVTELTTIEIRNEGPAE